MILPQRPAVVLLHCSASTSGQWQSLVERLQPGFRALAIDLHGHGTRPEWDDARAFTLADDAALVLPLLERLGGAHVVGHSYGGALALKVASLRPELVHSVAVYEPVWWSVLHGNPEGWRAMAQVLAVADWMQSRLAADDAHGAAQRFIEYWSGADAWRYMSPGRQAAIASRMPTVARHFEALFGESFPAARIDPGTPMLCLTGEETVPAARTLAQRFRNVLPHATHELLPGMGHMGPITHAAGLNPRIEEFLRSAEAAVRSTLTLTYRERTWK